METERKIDHNDPWPYYGYTPFIFEDLIEPAAGAISGDGYIVPCYGYGHALAWNGLPEDHQYRVWAEKRWRSAIDYADNNLMKDGYRTLEYGDFLAFERGVSCGKFHFENGIHIRLGHEYISIEGTQKGIEHQQHRMNTFNERFFDGKSRILVEKYTIRQDEIDEFPFDLPKPLRN